MHIDEETPSTSHPSQGQVQCPKCEAWGFWHWQRVRGERHIVLVDRDGYVHWCVPKRKETLQ